MSFTNDGNGNYFLNGAIKDNATWSEFSNEINNFCLACLSSSQRYAIGQNLDYNSSLMISLEWRPNYNLETFSGQVNASGVFSYGIASNARFRIYYGLLNYTNNLSYGSPLLIRSGNSDFISEDSRNNTANTNAPSTTNSKIWLSGNSKSIFLFNFINSNNYCFTGGGVPETTRPLVSGYYPEQCFGLTLGKHPDINSGNQMSNSLRPLTVNTGNKRLLLTSGEANYAIVAGGAADNPGQPINATDLYLRDNNSANNNPAIGKIPLLIKVTGNFVVGDIEPRLINGVEKYYICVGAFGSEYLMMPIGSY